MQTEHVKRGPSDEPKKQFCTFWLASHLYGVDILDVKEVNPEPGFTDVFHAPREVHGFVNIRGQIHLILNLRRILGLKEKPVDDKSRLVLFKPVVGESFGVLVDMIGDVVEVAESLIEAGDLADAEPLSGSGGDDKSEPMALISAVCRLKTSLLLIINARALLKCVDRSLAARV